MPKIVLDNFTGGLAPSRFIGATNQFDPGISDDDTSAGWSAHETDNINVLRRAQGTGSITGATILQGTITWMDQITLGSDRYLYAIEEGFTPYRLQRVDISNDTVTNASPWPQSLNTITGSAGTGMAFYNDGTQPYLYYANGRYLGRYDLSLTFNHSYNINLGTLCLGTYIYHPMVAGNGKLFIGNSNFSLNTACIAVVTGSTVDMAGLDLSKTAQKVECLEFDRNSLYIGMSTQGSELSANEQASLYVWDTVSSSWQEQFSFPESRMSAVKAVNGQIYCWGRRGFYRFTGSNFELIYEVSGSAEAFGVDSTPGGITVFPDETGQVYAYGSKNKLPSVPWKPFLNSTTINALKCVAEQKYYFMDSTAWKKFGGSGTLTFPQAIWRSPMFTLPMYSRITSIRVYCFSHPSGETLSVGLSKDDGASITSIGSITTAGTTFQKFDPNGFVTYAFQVCLTHSSGTSTPKVRKIEIDYEPEKN